MSAKKYRVYCNDEKTTVDGWMETEPTTCFNNNTHTIDTNQTVLVDIDGTQRIAQTYSSPTDGDSYYLYTLNTMVDENKDTDIPMEFDVDINMFKVLFETRQTNIGDEWSSYINKNTIIGVISETSTGTDIKMAEASVAYVKPGYFISVDGGTTQIRAISKTTDTVTLKESVSVTAGDIVMMTYYLVYRKMIMKPGEEILGDSIIGSSRVPTSFNPGITYHNNSNSKKELQINIEMTF